MRRDNIQKMTLHELQSEVADVEKRIKRFPQDREYLEKDVYPVRAELRKRQEEVNILARKLQALPTEDLVYEVARIICDMNNITAAEIGELREEIKGTKTEMINQRERINDRLSRCVTVPEIPIVDLRDEETQKRGAEHARYLKWLERPDLFPPGPYRPYYDMKTVKLY